MNRIAVLMTCHNRREETVTCLEALRRAQQQIPATECRVFLTDDGCSDGTAEAVRTLDENVAIVPGSGDLYWNRGMIAAWSAAEASKRGFDGFLLLNDDTVIDPECLKTLIATSSELQHRAIVVGAVRSPDTGELTYGGVVRLSSWHPGRTRLVPVSDQIQEAHTFNANCVLVPTSVHGAIGKLDPTFTHAMGDFDYGFRARGRGFRAVVAPGTVGQCQRNERCGTWRDPALPVLKRLRLLESPKGLPRRQWYKFLTSHGAPLPRLLAFIPIYMVVASSIAATLRRPLRSRNARSSRRAAG